MWEAYGDPGGNTTRAQVLTVTTTTVTVLGFFSLGDGDLTTVRTHTEKPITVLTVVDSFRALHFSKNYPLQKKAAMALRHLYSLPSLSEE